MLRKLDASLKRYLCAPVCVAIAVAIRLLLDPWLGDQFALATVFLAATFTAWYAGFLPGLLALALGYVAGDYFIIPPRGALGLADTEQFFFLVRYLVVGAGTTAMGGAAHMLRMRAERTAAKIRNQALLIDQVYDAVLVWDWQGALTFWNRGAQLLYGFTPDEANGRISHELLTAEVPGGLTAMLQRLETEGRWQGEVSHLTRDARRIWVEAHMVLVREGAYTYVVETNRDITARRELDSLRTGMQQQLEHQVEQRTRDLLRSEQRYRLLIQATAEVVWRADARGMPLDSAMLDYTGVTLAQVVSGEYLQAAAPTDRERVKRAWYGAVKSGSVFQCECSIRRASDGQWRDIRMSALPIKNAAGQIEEWIGVWVDITQRRQAERALSTSEEQFRVLLEGIQGYAILMLDPTGVILAWSKSAERIGGYRAEEIVGRTFDKLFAPQDLQAGRPQIELAQAHAQGKVEIEGWRVRKNGSRYWASGTLAALHGADEQLIGYVKVIRDVTEKRRNDELLYSVLDNALDTIVSVDMQGTISLFNRTGESMFGRSADEVVGQSMRLLLADASQAEYDDYLADYLHSGSARRVADHREMLGVRKDGSVFPLELSVAGFELDQQRYFICILRDISERKSLEAQLRQSQKLEAFGQLAGGVAHDFNNLLMVISGYSALLTPMLEDNREASKFVGEISRAGERAAALTRQLLASSRQQMLAPRVVDLNDIVRDVERMLLRVIGEDIQLTSALASGISSVKIDPGQIEQVIMNLVVNARDAMPQGGRLTIETTEVEVDAVYRKMHRQVRAGHFVVLTVSDTGQGMTADVKARMFEPFFTTKSVGKGTGLGLAVVHGIVKQSGGTIEVLSEVGLGTVIKIYLPAIKESPPIPTEYAPAPVANGNETILLVEDDAGVRELVARSLRSMGYKVLQAVDGRAALQLIESQPVHIDLLLTDVVMPEMNGRQLAEQFIRRHANARVLYMSGYTSDAAMRHGILNAEAAFLHKPFTLNLLASKVRESLTVH